MEMKGIWWGTSPTAFRRYKDLQSEPVWSGGTIKEVDMVNHPPHYNTGKVECIDAIESALGREGFIAYCKGNVIKYMWRAGLKGAPTQDLEKAEWYRARMLKTIAGE